MRPFTITYDDEELTEIESSDEEEDPPPPPPEPPVDPSPAIAPVRAKSTRPSTQTATEKSRARGGLQNVAPALKAYRSTTYSTYSLNEWIEDGLLDLDAEYQRGIVWNDAKQIGLIDSIIRNYYIPPIVFTVITKDDGNEVRVCIDGKQRLTSIRRFLLGEIPYKDVTNNQKYYFTSSPGARRKLLPEAMRNTFKKKQITCSEYESVTKEQEREIFQRVQMGMTLVPSDRLPAINGPYADLVRGLRSRIETTEGFGAYHNWGETRGKDFQALTQIVYLMSHGTEPKKSEPTTMRLEAFLSQAGVDVGPLDATANQVLDIFIHIAKDPLLSKPLEAELAPLEFVMTFYLIYTHRTSLSQPQLSAAIYHMRQKFRDICPDRKANMSVFKNILNFVLVSVRKLKLNIPIDWSAPEAPSREKIKGDPAKFSVTKGATKPSAKRKYVEEDEGESETDCIVPVKKKATAKHEVESKPSQAVASSSQAAPAKAPSRLKLQGRSASTSKAKTTVKKASPQKRAASGPVRKASVASTSSGITAQIATPSVRPSRASVPSSRANSVAPGDPSSSGLSLTSMPAPPQPTMTTAQAVPSSSNFRFPLSGNFTPANSPLIPASGSHFISGQSSIINEPDHRPTPPRDSSVQDYLAPLRDAKTKRGSIAGIVPASAYGSGQVSDVAPTASTSTGTLSKLPNFTKTKKGSLTGPIPPSPQEPEIIWNHPEILDNVGSGSLMRKPSVPQSAIPSMNSRRPTLMGRPQQQSSKPLSTNKPTLTHVLGVVQPPTRDPRPRPASVGPAPPAQLPTPPQAPILVSPQIPVQHLNLPPTQSASSSSQQPPRKRMRPSAAYPGPGNHS